MGDAQAHMQKVERLLRLGAEDTEEGRTAAHIAAKLIHKWGLKVGGGNPTYPVRPSKNNETQSPRTEVPRQEEVSPDLKWIKENLHKILRAGILVMGMGATVTVEVIVRSYEKKYRPLGPKTRNILAQRLAYDLTKLKNLGYVTARRGRKGGYSVTPGYVVKDNPDIFAMFVSAPLRTLSQRETPRTHGHSSTQSPP